MSATRVHASRARATGAARTFARPLDGNTGWLCGSSGHTPEHWEGVSQQGWRRRDGHRGVEPECHEAREPAQEPAHSGQQSRPDTLLIAGIQTTALNDEGPRMPPTCPSGSERHLEGGPSNQVSRKRGSGVTPLHLQG